MGTNLFGDDARIWSLHTQGFCVSRITGLVGLSDSYIRAIIASVWREDKLAGKRAKN